VKKEDSSIYQNIFVTQRTDFQPSQVYLWDDEEGLVVADYAEFQYAYKADPHGEFTSIYGEKLKKVWRPRYGEPGLYESDLPRATRVLTDLYLESDLPSTGHRLVCFDIEVSSEGGFAKPETAENEMTAVAIYNYVEDTYTVFLLDKEGSIARSKEGNEEVIPFRTEREMLEAFMEEYQRIKPTILTGWNCDGYDIPYLYNRLKRVFDWDMANSLSPVKLVQFNMNRLRYEIAGVSVLDYLALYKKFTYSQQPSYRLDAIGKVEIGMGKVAYEGTLDNLFKTDKKKFIDYNLTDVRIVVGIDRKMKLIELARFICHIGHVPYEDYSYSSKFIEGTIVTYLHRKGIIVSNKPIMESQFGEAPRSPFAKAEAEVGFAGAYVKAPFPGLYDWVYSLDLQSLYPSIIMSLNISPDSKRGRVFNWDVDRHLRKELLSYEVQLENQATEHMDRDQFLAWLTDHRYSISSNGILYSNDKTGIIPEILDKWFAERVQYKDLMKKYVKEGNAEQADFYDRRQHVQKILLNSIYGVLGLPIFRFYDLDNALAVTATGQDVIKTTAKYINTQYRKRNAIPKPDGWVNDYWNILKQEAHRHKEPVPDRPSAEDHCVYIDTDSVYFSAVELMDTDMIQQAQRDFTIATAREMEAAVNKFYDPMAKMLFNCDTHRFYIKGESVMETGFWVAKKRYAMKKVYDLETNKEMDKLAVKGLDVVRSSFPPAMRKFMSDVLLQILKKADKSVLDKMLLEFYTAMKDMHYTEIARNTAVNNVTKYHSISPSFQDFVSKTPAHVKAAITYNRLLTHFGLTNKYVPIGDGDKIKYVYLKRNPLQLEVLAIKTYDDPPEILEIVEKYIDHDALFEKEMANKLEDFYAALGWGMLPTQVNQTAFEFFDFV
jgi:Kyanoviridae DNA polymerase